MFYISGPGLTDYICIPEEMLRSESNEEVSKFSIYERKRIEWSVYERENERRYESCDENNEDKVRVDTKRNPAQIFKVVRYLFNFLNRVSRNNMKCAIKTLLRNESTVFKGKSWFMFLRTFRRIPSIIQSRVGNEKLRKEYETHLKWCRNKSHAKELNKGTKMKQWNEGITRSTFYWDYGANTWIKRCYWTYGSNSWIKVVSKATFGCSKGKSRKSVLSEQCLLVEEYI